LAFSADVSSDRSRQGSVPALLLVPQSYVRTAALKGELTFEATEALEPLEGERRRCHRFEHGAAWLFLVRAVTEATALG
jgi:hypothetical protein